MEQILQGIENFGFSTILLAYFLYKDYKFNQNILDVLHSMKVILGKLETWHNVEDPEK